MLYGSAWHVGHSSRVMAADIEECAELAIRSTHHDERLAGDFNGKKLAIHRDLIDPTHGDPVCTKDHFALRLLDTGIHIPRSGNRVRLFKGR